MLLVPQIQELKKNVAIERDILENMERELRTNYKSYSQRTRQFRKEIRKQKHIYFNVLFNLEQYLELYSMEC